MPHCSLPHAEQDRMGARPCSLLRALLAVSALAALPIAELAPAAVPGRMSDTCLPRLAGKPDNAEAAAALISGSAFPGVIDCALQRPAPGEKASGPDIHINYPSIGDTRIDEDIRNWVTGLADAFASHLDLRTLDLPDNDLAALDLSLAAGSMHAPRQEAVFELRGDYKVSRPSDKAVSIAFEIWNYTGNPEANLDILTLNYSLLTGQRLELVDIFEKPDIALELMSNWSRKMLEPRLGATRRAAMLAGGTAPLVENFSSLTLTPEGICINFQPWQVASRDAGIQKVIMPLEELMPSSPLLALWGK